jgi:quinoprotein glucose dehydrogenase
MSEQHPSRHSAASQAVRCLGCAVLLTVAIGCLSGGGAMQAVLPNASAGDWPAYGRDAGGTRYAPLAQIRRDNVQELHVAWVYHTHEARDASVVGHKAAFEATPILADGTLYLSTPFSRVIALDPATGSERWSYNPHVDLSLRYSEVTSRGVSTWLDPTRDAQAPCRRRIFVGTIDARLIALDAATGVPCHDFGRDGQVDLTRDVRLVQRSEYQVTSPPAIIGDMVIVGSAIGDNRDVVLERGVVRAYEARTGHLHWSWDPIPQQSDDPARHTWDGESATRTGAANAWAVISADPERGLVFVPTSSPSPDFYGGERGGSNLYANAVVALHALTGRVVWHFQVVHHDLWDYDVASQPTLVTVQREGRGIPAVAVGTKMGHLFVLHRDTGAPLFPVEERPVPRSTVPGEQTWPTQPFPTRPPALVPHTLTSADAWGVTPADRDWCRERIQALRSEGVFTPPSLEGTIVFPGNVGGMHWGSMSYDPERGLLVVNTNRLATMVKLIPRADYDSMQPSGAGGRLRGEFGRQAGTPYGVYREPLLAPSGVPCNPPPWGTLAAVELATGAVRWEVPLGTVPPLAQLPQASAWGSINLGGSMVTGGGLVFIAAAMDTSLRAFDIETGQELWKGELPASAQATPMTYRLGEHGKQFVVVAAGGHGKIGTKLGDAVVAFALP